MFLELLAIKIFVVKINISYSDYFYILLITNISFIVVWGKSKYFQKSNSPSSWIALLLGLTSLVMKLISVCLVFKVSKNQTNQMLIPNLDHHLYGLKHFYAYIRLIQGLQDKIISQQKITKNHKNGKAHTML